MSTRDGAMMGNNIPRKIRLKRRKQHIETLDILLKMMRIL